MSHKDLLNKIWTAVYDPTADTAQVIEKFFHPDYEQCINGVVMQRKEYIDHVIAQKNNIIIDSIHYEHTLELNNELFSLYFPKGRNINGGPIEAEVIAYFKFKEDQIINIHGQVRMIAGKPSDIDMNDQ